MEIDMSVYLKNRLQFPLHELAKHAGEWVAWSPDGTRIVAHTSNPEALDDLVRAAGEDPEQCPLRGLLIVTRYWEGLTAHEVPVFSIAHTATHSVSGGSASSLPSHFGGSNLRSFRITPA